MSNEYHHWKSNFYIRDSPDWQKKYPTGPVHFDVKCRHNREVKDLSPLQLPETSAQWKTLFPCCFN